MSDPRVPRLIDHLFRDRAGRMVATLTRILGPENLDLAEDVVQDALVQALRVWPFRGIPDEPTAWLVRVARNRALDVLRRRRLHGAKLEELRRWGARAAEESAGEVGGLDDEILDDRLRMVFMACHPSLSPAARVALTLKTAGGFGVGEIARAFLTAEATVAQRLVRAKRRLRDERVAFEMPDPSQLAGRLDSVVEVLYLMFNEGYGAHRGECLVRHELVDEALRLGEILAGHPVTGSPAVHGLLALMLLQGARLPARLGDDGRLMLLAEQDRSLWDRAMISRGFHHLRRSARGEQLTEYHIQAAIAACHVAAPSVEETDWPAILGHYDALHARQPSPVVALNRAVAVAMVEGPEAGLELLDALADEPSLARYYLYHATRADLLRRLQRREAASDSYRRALEAVGTAPERRFLEERLKDLPDSRPPAD